jgi:ATP-binding cassette, subfamily B, bacterial MsbA
MLKKSTSDTHPSGFVTYKRLLTYLRPYLSKFLLAIVSMAIFGATDGAIPYLLKMVLDDVFGSQNKQMLWVLVGILMVFSVVRGLFGFLQKYLTAMVGHSIVKDLRNQIFDKFLVLSPSYFEKTASGGLISRVTNDALLVRTALTDAVASLLRDTIRIIALVSVAFYLDPILALIAFIGFPLCIYPVIVFGKKVKRFSRSGQEQFGGITGLLGEVISGHKVIRIFSRENFERKRFEKENETFTNYQLKAEKYGALSSPTNEVFATLAIAAVLVYGGLSVIGGVRTQGDFIAFITSVFLLYEPFKKLSRINATLQTGLAAADRIFELIDEPVEVEDKGTLLLDSAINQITFDKVSFSYSKNTDSNIPVLYELNFTINNGTTIAIVGESGAGKSTLVNLLPRFYEATSGKILIDNKDITLFTLDSLRRQISLVSQHVFLFNDTIYNNIVYGRESATEEEVREAAKKAYALEFIERLHKGFDTDIGEQGMRLSGGQRARISIARALLKDAPVLILDEATASLDNESEDQVQRAIDALMSGRTTFVIAHRLSTIQSADSIFVMKAGKIVERGSHQELLQLEGEYARLYNIQFKKSVQMVENA